MQTIKVLLCSPDDGLMVKTIESVLREGGYKPTCVVVPDKDDLDSIEREITDAVVVYPNKARITAGMISSAENLRLIHCGTGYDTVDLGAARESGIAVCTTGDAMACSTAEHTLLLILSLAKGSGDAFGELRQGQWIQRRGVELSGKILGLLGYGNIARRVARLAHGFGMRILASRGNMTSGNEGLEFVQMVDFDQLLEKSDILSLHLPLVISNPGSTLGLIGRDELSRFGQSGLGWLVNTSRGAIVDENAMIRALQEGILRKAALDVFVNEPLPQGSVLRKLPNVLLTPHIAGETFEALKERYRRIGHNALKILWNEKPLNAIISPDIMKG